MDGPYLRLNSKRHSIKREMKNRYNLKSPEITRRLTSLITENKILESDIVEERRRREDIQSMYLLKSSELRSSVSLLNEARSEREIVRKGAESLFKSNKRLKRTIRDMRKSRGKENELFEGRVKEWEDGKVRWEGEREELLKVVKCKECEVAELGAKRREEETYLRVLEGRLGEIKFDQGSRGDKKVIKELRGKVEELEKRGEEERKVKEELEGENER